MINIEKIETYGWEAAIRGMRNPMNSWDKSDSELCKGMDGFEDCRVSPLGVCPRHEDFRHDIFCVGKNDLKLMKKLSKAGNDHAKFLRMITVSMDITAPLYWWKEFDTYKVGTVRNSCSTMHKIHAKEFTMDDFSCEHLYGKAKVVLEDYIIPTLNDDREWYQETKDKDDWWQMIQLIPSSYNQKSTVTVNYQVLKSMYFARRNHKLDEWKDFCEAIRKLPYFEEICVNKGDAE